MTTLEAIDVSIAYPKSGVVVRDFSGAFHAGELVAITGASGSGKSTLLYALGLMIRPSAGDVRVAGEGTARARDAKLASLRAHRYGFVFQDACLDPTRTVLDNVIEGALYRGQPRGVATTRAAELLARFGVLARSDHKPGQISGGQAQRIAVCRALLGEPPLVLADEPTGNLDEASADTVLTAFADHALQGGTVVIATHDPRVVARSHRTIQL